MKKIILILSVVSLLVFVAVVNVKENNFDQECEGYLKRAADANTIELATVELEKAVEYCENHSLTEGFTSVLCQTPDEDLGFWYKNLKTSLEELKSVKKDASALEKSNMLLKLRETLLDAGEKGCRITVPYGVALYPNNMLFAVWGFGSILLLLTSSYFLLFKDWEISTFR